MEETFINAGDLVEARKTKVVEVPDKGKVKIQSLTFGEISEIYSSTKDVFKQSAALLKRGLLEPALTWEQANQLNPKIVTFILREILVLSGYTPEEIESGKKLLGQTGEGLSSSL